MLHKLNYINCKEKLAKSLSQILNTGIDNLLCAKVFDKDTTDKLLNKSMKIATVDLNNNETYILRVFEGEKFLFKDNKDHVKIFVSNDYVKRKNRL